jgi:sugar lactone lactonase YvrE
MRGLPAQRADLQGPDCAKIAAEAARKRARRAAVHSDAPEPREQPDGDTHMQRMKQVWRVGFLVAATWVLAACGSGDNCDGCINATTAYSGSITGLPAGKSVVLQDNVGTTDTLSANGGFTFTTYAPPGFPALVGVLVQPAGTDCAVSNGPINNSGVVGVTVTCAPVAAGVTSLITDFAGMLSQGSAEGSGTAASFNAPGGIATDAAGNVFVADTGNNTIRMITSAGVVSTLAGTAGSYGSADASGPLASFKSPGGVATDAAGNVYVADTVNSTIRKITPAGAVSTLAGAPGVLGSADGQGSLASFRNPLGVAVDGAGNVYVADTGNNTIRMITSGGLVSTLAGTAGTLGSADGTGAAARFAGPAAVAVDASGNIIVADYYNNTIRKIAGGVVTTLAGSAQYWGSSDGTGAAALFNGPQGLAADAAGNVYVADTYNFTVRKVSSAGVVTTVVGVAGLQVFDAGILPGALEAPYGVALSGTTLYISTNGGVAAVSNVP